MDIINAKRNEVLARRIKVSGSSAIVRLLVAADREVAVSSTELIPEGVQHCYGWPHKCLTD